MNSGKNNNHGEPPSFVKWLIWIFQNNTWKRQPIVASVAVIIVVFSALSGIYGAYKIISDSSKSYSTARKVIVLMDSPLPEVVYDSETRSDGGTNADDITEAIDQMPVLTVKETTSLSWRRDDEVLRIDPDLILIHLSAFYGHTNLLDSSQRMEKFLQYMALSRVKFIVYTRAPELESITAQVNWVRQVESSIPELTSRIQIFYVPGGPMATFRNSDTAKKLKLVVKNMLDL